MGRDSRWGFEGETKVVGIDSWWGWARPWGLGHVNPSGVPEGEQPQREAA